MKLRKVQVEINVLSFEKAMTSASKGDIVYCDPIYTTSDRGQFDRYNPDLFGWEEQGQLSEAARSARDRGALVIISNTFVGQTRDLYQDAYRIVLERRKSIANRAKCADRALEYLIILNPECCRRDWSTLGLIEPIRRMTKNGRSRIAMASDLDPGVPSILSRDHLTESGSCII